MCRIETKSAAADSEIWSEMAFASEYCFSIKASASLFAEPDCYFEWNSNTRITIMLTQRRLLKHTIKDLQTFSAITLLRELFWSSRVVIQNRVFELYAMAPTVPSARCLVTISEEKISLEGRECGASSARPNRILLKYYFRLASLAQIDRVMYCFVNKRGPPTPPGAQITS
jgi:hypothetical protein